MEKRATIPLVAVGLIIGVAVASYLWPRSLTPKTLQAEEDPDEIRLQSRVRDFRRSHPDFDIPPTDGAGPRASLIAFELDDEHRPVRVDGGYRVIQPWKDDLRRNIAPHLFGGESGALSVEETPRIAANAVVDTWDSSVGPYGGSNVGPEPEYDTHGALPLVQAPTGMPPSIGDMNLQGASVVMSGDQHCNNFRLLGDSTVEIVGDVTILCDGAVSIGQSSRIVLAAGASLTLYFRANFDMHQSSAINPGGDDPDDVWIYNLGGFDMDIAQYAELVARIESPRGSFRLGQDTEFWGTYAGEGLDVGQNSEFHLDTRWFAAPCGGIFDDQRGRAGDASDASISSPETFATWYRDVLGTNLSARHVIVLRREYDGLYKHHSEPFYPIDDRLFGNEGLEHNFHFTLAAEATLVYEACTGQYFKLATSGDAWICIDDQVGIDLGGLKPNSNQVIDLDRLDLVDGETYSFRLFYSHRTHSELWFSLETNVVLDPGPDRPVSEGFD